MGNAFELRQVGVIGNTRLVVAQGKGRIQPRMGAWPNLKGASVFWAVVNQPHHAELKWVAVGMAAVWPSGLVTVGQRAINPSRAVIAQGRIRRPARPSRAMTAHWHAVYYRLAQVTAH